MADFSALKTSIQNYIKQNGNEEITGNLLQQILLSMVSTLGDSAINDLVAALNTEIANRGNADTELGGSITTLQGVVNGIKANVENGYVYAGIATPSTTPASGKVFYLALTAGTYNNFGATVVPQGINILKYNGSAWSLDSFLGLDDAPTQGSSNLVKSGGVLDSIIKDGSAFDLSAYNNGTTYADLSAALTALNALPAVYKKGGMSVKYVQSSDNKYVQFRYISNSTASAAFTNVNNWQKQGAEVTITSTPDSVLINIGNISYDADSLLTKCFDNTFMKKQNPNIIEGKYISSQGIVRDNADYCYTEDIVLAPNEYIVMFGHGSGTNVAMIAEHINSSYVSLIHSYDENYGRVYFYKNNTNLSKNICLSYCIDYQFGAWKTSIIDKPIDETPQIGSSNPVSSGGVVSTFEELTNVSFSRVNGYFINPSGIKSANSDYLYTTPIFLPKYSTINVFCRGYQSNVAIISECDNNGNNIIPKVISRNSNFDWYKYSPYSDTYVIISCNKVDAPLYVVIDYSETLKDISSGINAVTEDDFIVGESVGTYNIGKNLQNNNGYANVVDGENRYRLVEYTITTEKAFRVYCTAGPNLAYGIGYCYVDSNNRIIEQYNEEVYGNYYVNSYVPTGAVKIYVNGVGIAPSCNVCTIEKTANHNYVDYINPELSLSLFQKIGVVGDSYASGALYYNGAFHNIYEISWPQQIARKFGVTATNFSIGGLTTRTWLTSDHGLSLMNSTEAQDIYLLALGINDYSSLGIDYLGDITDITNYQSYTDYPDTFYGNYGKIIEQIILHAPNAKLILFGLVDNAAVPSQFTSAIQTIASHYNIPFINQRDDKFIYDSIYTDMVGGHPTALGYSMMAVAFERLLCKCIIDNKNYFKNFRMY